MASLAPVRATESSSLKDLATKIDRFVDPLCQQLNLHNKILGAPTQKLLSGSALSQLGQPTWTIIGPYLSSSAVSFLQNWSSFGGGFSLPAFMRDALGFVHVKGTFNAGANFASGASINSPFPVGYRPKETWQFAGKWNKSGTDQPGIFQVTNHGVLQLLQAVSSGDNVSFSVVYLAEQ